MPEGRSPQANASLAHLRHNSCGEGAVRKVGPLENTAVDKGLCRAYYVLTGPPNSVFQVGLVVEIIGTASPARTGDPQIHNLVGHQ